MTPIYLCMGLDFTLRNNPLKQLWRAFTLLVHSTCPILPLYRTTSKTNSLHLSDSSTLSDNHQDNLTPLVRFLHFIGQPARQSHSACPILPLYRTTSKTISLRLSDFSTLSDNQQDNLTPLVRFLRIIGQPARLTHYTCPILPHYRTTTTDQAYFNAISSTNLVTSLKASQQSSNDL